jgi:hypothetical protein
VVCGGMPSVSSSVCCPGRERTQQPVWSWHRSQPVLSPRLAHCHGSPHAQLLQRTRELMAAREAAGREAAAREQLEAACLELRDQLGLSRGRAADAAAEATAAQQALQGRLGVAQAEAEDLR